MEELLASKRCCVYSVDSSIYVTCINYDEETGIPFTVEPVFHLEPQFELRVLGATVLKALDYTEAGRIPSDISVYWKEFCWKNFKIKKYTNIDIKYPSCTIIMEDGKLKLLFQRHVGRKNGQHSFDNHDVVLDYSSATAEEIGDTISKGLGSFICEKM